MEIKLVHWQGQKKKKNTCGCQCCTGVSGCSQDVRRVYWAVHTGIRHLHMWTPLDPIASVTETQPREPQGAENFLKTYCVECLRSCDLNRWFGKFWVLLVSTPKHGLTLWREVPSSQFDSKIYSKRRDMLERARRDFLYFDICWQIALEIIRESLKELWGFNLTSWTYVLIHIFLLQFHLWNGMNMIAHFFGKLVTYIFPFSITTFSEAARAQLMVMHPF